MTNLLPASLGFEGFAYTEFNGKFGSPGMSNFEIASVYISWSPWLFVLHFCKRLRHSVIYNVM